MTRANTQNVPRCHTYELLRTHEREFKSYDSVPSVREIRKNALSAVPIERGARELERERKRDAEHMNAH